MLATGPGTGLGGSPSRRKTSPSSQVTSFTARRTMRLAGCAQSKTMAAAARVRRGRAPSVRTRPRCSIRSGSGIGAEWPVTAWGSWNRPVSLLAMHHWRKGRTALRWFSLLPACQASMSDLLAAPGLAVTPRRARQGPPATPRTAGDLPPDSDHHRPGHRCPLPPGPALRQPSLAQDLRHLAQHHRRPQRPRQRPRPRSPRPARPAPRPRHRRPVHLHRPAADGRQHPQNPRLARPHRPRQDPHHPARTAAPGQPPRYLPDG